MYFDRLIEDAKALRSKCDKLYVYGCGYYGKDIYKILKRGSIEIDGFIVTNLAEETSILGTAVYQAAETVNKNTGIILGLSDSYAEEVLEYLKEFDVDPSYIVNGWTYINGVYDQNAKREKIMIDVTTVIGCSVDCKYCPQKLLISRYFKDDKNRKSRMTVDDFRIYLEHTPANCEFAFCGMSEPFLNKDCMEMIKMACSAGRDISLFTTLVGLPFAELQRLVNFPIRFVTLHVADKFNNAKIQVDEEYYRKIEFIINARKQNGTPFVDVINTQAEPDVQVAKMCESKYEILTALQDRAGNLGGSEDDALDKCHQTLEDKKIYCSRFGLDLNDSVLLPDGTLVLCSNDFGLQHQLGNLLQDDYETIRHGEEMHRILRSMDGDSSIDLLCRKCLLSRTKE